MAPSSLRFFHEEVALARWVDSLVGIGPGAFLMTVGRVEGGAALQLLKRHWLQGHVDHVATLGSRSRSRLDLLLRALLPRGHPLAANLVVEDKDSPAGFRSAIELWLRRRELLRTVSSRALHERRDGHLLQDPSAAAIVFDCPSCPNLYVLLLSCPGSLLRLLKLVLPLPHQSIMILVDQLAHGVARVHIQCLLSLNSIQDFTDFAVPSRLHLTAILRVEPLRGGHLTCLADGVALSLVLVLDRALIDCGEGRTQSHLAEVNHSIHLLFDRLSVGVGEFGFETRCICVKLIRVQGLDLLAHGIGGRKIFPIVCRACGVESLEMLVFDVDFRVLVRNRRCRLLKHFIHLWVHGNDFQALLRPKRCLEAGSPLCISLYALSLLQALTCKVERVDHASLISIGLLLILRLIRRIIARVLSKLDR